LATPLAPCYHPRVASALIASLRPRQWTKNGFVYAALVFDGQLTHWPALLHTTLGFALFCLASSCIYLVNDIRDLDEDRRHPTKRNRPLPSGRLSIRVAAGAAIVLGVVSVGGAFLLAPAFGRIVLAYVLLFLFYSFRLKHIPILDVFAIAAGFVLRVAGGVVLITVMRFSPWLYVCTTLVALYFGFGKRRAELTLLTDNAGQHRPVLDGYTLPLLDSLIIIVSSATIMAYSLYTFSAQNLPANHLMMLTIPIVMYGIFRYLWLIQVEGAGGAPDELILTDRPLLLTFLLWGMAAVGILYLGT
ncbi:MAG TPA: decaprenyl-phosphate phosphoribosyltransferase, partial [Anaerolineales bacterium]|nr:decaprenyl-phosphate phosphoribosyltransferase [Anaerolineales bacterium]